MEIVPLYSRTEARAFQAGPIIINHYFGPPSLVGIGTDFDLAVPVIERFGEVSYIVVFEPQLVGRPNPHVVSAVRQRLLGLGSKLRCSPLVVRGHGLSASLMRVMMSGAAFMAGDSTRWKVFGTVHEGLSWLQGFEQQLPCAREVGLEALEALLNVPADQ